MKVEKNRRYWCRCCGHDFSHEEGLKYGEVIKYTVRGQQRQRRLFQCPMCSAPKKYCDTYLGPED